MKMHLWCSHVWTIISNDWVYPRGLVLHFISTSIVLGGNEISAHAEMTLIQLELYNDWVAAKDRLSGSLSVHVTFLNAFATLRHVWPSLPEKRGSSHNLSTESEAIFVPPTLFCPRHDNGLWFSRVAAISHVLPWPFCACAVFALSDVFVQNMFQFPDVWQDKRLCEVTCGQIKDNSEEKLCWWSKSNGRERWTKNNSSFQDIHVFRGVTAFKDLCFKGYFWGGVDSNRTISLTCKWNILFEKSII